MKTSNDVSCPSSRIRSAVWSRRVTLVTGVTSNLSASCLASTGFGKPNCCSWSMLPSAILPLAKIRQGHLTSSVVRPSNSNFQDSAPNRVTLVQRSPINAASSLSCGSVDSVTNAPRHWHDHHNVENRRLPSLTSASAGEGGLECNDSITMSAMLPNYAVGLCKFHHRTQRGDPFH